MSESARKVLFKSQVVNKDDKLFIRYQLIVLYAADFALETIISIII